MEKTVFKSSDGLQNEVATLVQVIGGMFFILLLTSSLVAPYIFDTSSVKEWAQEAIRSSVLFLGISLLGYSFSKKNLITAFLGIVLIVMTIGNNFHLL